MPHNAARAIACRIAIAQALSAGGALLSLISTDGSIGLIVLVRLNYANAQRTGLLRRRWWPR